MMNPEVWEQPASIGDPLDNLDPFPLEAFPKVLRDYAEYVLSVINGADSGLVASAIMWTLCVAEGPAWIKVGEEYKEPSPLWFLPVGSSGAMKSPIINAIKAVLHEVETEIQDLDAQTRDVREIEYDHACDEFESAQAEYRTFLAEGDGNANTKAALSQKVMDARATMNAARKVLGDPPRLIITGSGVTGERINDLLSKYEHLGVVMTEGIDHFTNLADKTNKTREVWLKAWDMDANDRELVTREAGSFKHGSVPKLTAIQPSVFSEFTKDGKLTGVGFTARYLPCRMRQTKLKAQPFMDAADLAVKQGFTTPVDPAKQAWHDLIRHEVMRTWLNHGDPITFQFNPSDGSKALHEAEFIEYANELNVENDEASDDRDHIAAALSKMRGQVLRLARLFAQIKIVVPATQNGSNPFGISDATLNKGTPTLSTTQVHLIDRESLESAWTIARWYFRQYESIFAPAEITKEALTEHLARRVLHKARRCKESKDYKGYVTGREVSRGVKFPDGTPISAIERDRILTLCVTAGWLRTDTLPRHGVVYTVHPDIDIWIKKYGY